ncbi:hypothetical protein [Asticcacaulis excentricus]|uniref:Uncharacterized protein n=1 Tax=Asticcacaulis excentricus (strain ATCC 15261 / DSM 4724 / KCTC 12464 / NCIMB 9791 / VKM B-1370 / CB 48) TaxID=573065 RepID=E8RR01_ASTEC|nr:hypothetical protein [Asticcacaulis excentricus]ADU12264.1 hypothetical protein Astex_0576 [Asticcacaulis excentricus CB 48]
MQLNRSSFSRCLVAALIAVSPAVFAAEPALTVSEEKAAELLVLSTHDLLETSYKCQGVIGPETYDKAKEMTVVLFSAMGADEKLSNNFIASQDATFTSECKDKESCWRTYMNMPTQSEDEGEIACLKKNNETLALIKSLLKIITGTT